MKTAHVAPYTPIISLIMLHTRSDALDDADISR